MTVIEQNPDLIHDLTADDYWDRYQLQFALYSVSDRAIPSAYDGLQARPAPPALPDARLKVVARQQASEILQGLLGGDRQPAPHGGTSMYGAAALLAADFQRVKIIDGQGAFPRIQGDIPPPTGTPRCGCRRPGRR